MANCQIKTSNKVRFAYNHLITPAAPPKGGREKYSTCIFIKKDDPCVAELKTRIEQVYRDNASVFKEANGSVKPYEKIRIPLRDGDVERPGDANYAGHYFLNAYSWEAPIVVDANKTPITDEKQLPSGMIGRAVLSLYPYDREGNAGIGANILAVQKHGDSRRAAILNMLD